MIGETYELYDETVTSFIFFSRGSQGVIAKNIIYQQNPKQKNLYNLAFGDVTVDGLNDSVVSNNNDLIKVMNTVAQSVYIFTERNPNAIISFTGVDIRRSRLYQAILERKFDEINPVFHIEARRLDNQVWEDFKAGENYSSFRLTLK